MSTTDGRTGKEVHDDGTDSCCLPAGCTVHLLTENHASTDTQYCEPTQHLLVVKNPTANVPANAVIDVDDF